MRLVPALLALAFLAGGAPAGAQDAYPSRAVRIVVSYGAGGAIDVATRIIAEHMATTLGKPTVVENKPGAGGTIAGELVAHSPPDGYTVLVTGAAHSVMRELYPQAPFDVDKDFAPISHFGNMPFVLAVHPSMPKDLPGFIAHLKANPGKVNFGSAGAGSSADLAALLFGKMADVSFVRVPYRSTPAAMNDLVAGQVQFMLDSQNVLAPQVLTGALRGLAVSSTVRSKQLPDIQTLDELGLKGFEASSWQVMLAPAKTPKPIVDRLAAAITAALADPGVQKRYADVGYQIPSALGPENLTAFLARESAKWGPLAKQAGVAN